MLESLFAQLMQVDGRILSQLFVVAGVVIAATILVVRQLSPRRRRDSGIMLRALDEGSRGQLVIARPGLNGDFIATFDPAPEPFAALSLTRVHAPRCETGASHRRRRAKFDQLRVEGVLAAPVRAELLWGRGQIPARPLRRRKGVDLWDQHRIDLTGSEFVVRGSNTGAVQHALFDLQQRFNPFLREVAIGANADPILIITVELTYGFNAEDASALLKPVRAAGRAALLG